MCWVSLIYDGQSLPRPLTTLSRLPAARTAGCEASSRTDHPWLRMLSNRPNGSRTKNLRTPQGPLNGPYSGRYPASPIRLCQRRIIDVHVRGGRRVFRHAGFISPLPHLSRSALMRCQTTSVSRDNSSNSTKEPNRSLFRLYNRIDVYLSGAFAISGFDRLVE